MTDHVPSVGRGSLARRWLVLLALSALIGGTLEFVRLPAALLLGPMLAAIALSASGNGVRVAQPVFMLAQAVVGVLIARAMPPSVFGEMGAIWPIITVGVVFVVVIANGLGWLIARRGILPGTTAVWGSSPGAATAMVIMAGAYGGDMRLVAMMQYLRVIMVAGTASLVARFAIGHAPEGAAGIDWLPPVEWASLAETMAVVTAGLAVTRLFRLATGAMIVPMLLAILLQGTGTISVELPPILLAAGYTVIGWSIGLRFTPEILKYAARALPVILGSILTLIGLCALFGYGLTVFAGIDPLTAYLASSPGGADSVAIIAASAPVDVPFVMAMQTVRFILVLLTGPAVARFIAARMTAEARDLS
jgi:membrane AbrB-like protein